MPSNISFGTNITTPFVHQSSKLKVIFWDQSFECSSVSVTSKRNHVIISGMSTVCKKNSLTTADDYFVGCVTVYQGLLQSI